MGGFRVGRLMRILPAVVLMVIAGTGSAAAGQRAASVTVTPAALGDCGCMTTGPFVDPKQGVVPTQNPPAGSSFTTQTSTAGEPPGITDVKVFQGTTQLLDTQTQEWGFSPDGGNRFVTWSLDTSDLLHVTLYDLTSATPSIPIWNGGTPAGTSSAVVQFGPGGRYIFVSAITGGSQVYMSIANAQTGARALEQTVTPSSSPTDGSVAGWDSARAASGSCTRS